MFRKACFTNGTCGAVLALNHGRGNDREVAFDTGKHNVQSVKFNLTTNITRIYNVFFFFFCGWKTSWYRPYGQVHMYSALLL